MIREASKHDSNNSLETEDLEEKKNVEETEDPNFVRDDCSEKKSSNYFFWFQSSNSRRLSNAEGLKEESVTSREIEDMRKESLLAKTVRNIRNKFIDRNLIGKIFIRHMTGIFSSACMCEIGATDRKSYQINEDISDLSFPSRRALSMTDTILDSLERRSLAWDGVEFGEEVLLTRGATLGITDPFFGVIGFSFTLEISANVKTLLISRKKYEMEQQVAREEARARELQRSDSKRNNNFFLPRINLSFLVSSTSTTTSNKKEGGVETNINEVEISTSNYPLDGREETKEEDGAVLDKNDMEERQRRRGDSETVYCDNVVPVSMKGCGWRI